jgi:ribonucleoside-triphosphate reductase (thioredoxin)
MIDVDRFGTFALGEDAVAAYRTRPVPWGFGALSRVTFARTYSRDGEQWWETCRRVIEGTFTVQRIYCLERGLPWDERRAAALAANAYARLFEFKWTPPGRGLWCMGTRFVYERGGAALNNCGFVSTKDLASDFCAPFLWMFRMSMLGVGVGFDTRGKRAVTIRAPARSAAPHRIEDSREGWAQALERCLGAYVGGPGLPSEWDVSAVRPRGSRLQSFGGYASGPAPLRDMLTGFQALYDEYAGREADARLIVDTMNIIGKCVVAGGIRRSAQIAFGERDDVQFLDLKRDAARVRDFRWASNNSVFAELGMDYRGVAERTAENGEPGYFWLENARTFGRLQDAPDWRDERAEGSNPCVEQTLWDRELCCLVETFPARHDTLEDYLETLRVAYQYAKTVTLIPTQDAITNAVMMRNRRIGCSMTGVVQAIGRLGYRTFFRWCDEAYRYMQQLDREYSDWLGVPRSIKTTSVKPSGTVSLLAGATPGVHWGFAPYYVRRVRVTAGHPLADLCRAAGYRVEEDAYATGAVVVSFPVHVPGLVRGQDEVPLWEKVDLAAQMQRYWSDNQVSCTASFDPDTERGAVPRILEAYEDRLKAISFLPVRSHGYRQPPYERITPQEYAELTAALRPLTADLEHEEQLEARFCEGEVCEEPG